MGTEMKEQTQNAAIVPLAGGSANHGPENRQDTHQDAGKIFLQKKRGRRRNFSEADVEREAQEREALLKREGLVDKGKKELAREAAFDDLQDYELCQDLAGRHARESTKKTDDAIGDVRDRYEAIALGFRCARGAQSSEAPLALGTALNALAEEFGRDRKGLLHFLDAVFKRWGEIDQPNSLWRVQLITQQHLGGPKVVGQYLENTGLVSKCTHGSHTESLRARIKQYRSRDRKKALKKRQKAR
jgi:hypothetical protein